MLAKKVTKDLGWDFWRERLIWRYKLRRSSSDRQIFEEMHRITRQKGNEKEWFLVDMETIEQVRHALLAAEKHVDEDCARSGCLCDLCGDRCSQRYTDAIHALDTGLHTTDAVPSDWRGDGDGSEMPGSPADG